MRLAIALFLLSPFMAFTQCPTLTAYGDTSVCGTASVQLNASSGFTNYAWSPAAGLSNPSIPNPVATVTGPASYILTATGYGPNLIPNPDFSLGYTGFTTGHTYSSFYSPGNAFVGSGYFIYTTLTDHTPTTDNFMFQVDGSTSLVTLYETTIPITANTNYDFSFWGSDADVNQPIYEIHFIGNITGDVIVATYPGIPYPGFWNWSHYIVPSWNSGLNTNLTVRIINLDLAGYGNDFGMDDFEFRSVCTKTDTVVIQQGLGDAGITGPAAICTGQGASLVANGGGTYAWNNGSNTSAILVSPAGSTSYSVIVTDPTGLCSDTLYHTLNVIPPPVATITGSTTLCAGGQETLTATGGSSYFWNTGETSATVTISPVVSTQYTVTVSNGACTDTASIDVNVVSL
ncbi:MAG TPA: hypothetical protein VD905_18390, partial [Flavobacteriales bacterium]|nr:hypothetical protein [Flavobacteriales bacterium]